MRTLVFHGPRDARVDDLPAPVAGDGEVVIDVDRVGICGTDIELYTGRMVYFEQGHSRFPLRPGHEWTGRVSAIGTSVDPQWLGKQVTGDTMLGCGSCIRCLDGRAHVCESRSELGIRGRWSGALAEQLLFPARYLHEIPPHVPVAAAALVEPAANALRSVEAGQVVPGSRVLVIGAGTVGLLAAQFAVAAGADVHLLGKRSEALDLALDLGVQSVARLDQDSGLSPQSFSVVIDASSDARSPARGLDLVEPAGRLVLVGLSDEVSTIDTRVAVLADVTVVGILGATPALPRVIAAFADGSVDPTSLVAEVVGLDQVADRLEGNRVRAAAPKVQVDPRR